MAEPKHSIEALMQRHYNDMVRLACSILRDPAEADDAAQAAFIAAARSLETFEGRAEIRTWLYRITANTCLSMLRKRRARRALQNALAGVQALLGGGSGLEEHVAACEERERVRAAVDQLDDRHRLPLVLFYEQGLSTAEIAAVLDLNEGTVHSRLHYARQKLLRQLQPDPADEEPVQEAAR